ncbi:hypothetical protein [Desulfosarcina sp.]|uniref:hypothetical protein n=1 Tax=Desulfosarcina sp. TaxID=2027861 RepID=UPI003565FB9B
MNRPDTFGNDVGCLVDYFKVAKVTFQAASIHALFLFQVCDARRFIQRHRRLAVLLRRRLSTCTPTFPE